MGLVALLGLLTRAAVGWVQELQQGLLEDHIRRLIHEQSGAVRTEFYDFPEFHDHLHRARDEAGYRPARLLDAVGGLFRSATTLCALAAVLVAQGSWLLPVVMLLGAGPSLWGAVLNTLGRQAWRLGVTKLERRTWYYDHLLTARESAAEMRALGLTAPYVAAYQRLRSRFRRERLNLMRQEGVRELAALLLGLVVAGAAGVWIINEALTGRMTVGGLAMFYAAFVQGQSAMRMGLRSAAELFANTLFLGNLFAFLALDPEPDGGRGAAGEPLPSSPSPRGEGVRFEGLEFSYPGSARAALSGFNLDVPAGKTVAIVGANGAGKSTVFKLLCRFYEPQAGRILIEGRPIAERAPEDVRRSLSVLFQEPVRFSATVQESVALVASDETPSLARVRAAMRGAGAEGLVERLPDRYDTLLGKEFENGAELSAGEWQRIALARALMRPVPIVLLDEPTSAMDSWAESEWFDRLRAATSGRTTLIITHRFTTAMRADVIHVMDAGRIVESGTHEDLVTAGGAYASSWARQSRDSQPDSAGQP
jgi:ATP-binding cassette, subfamily B, bacterial